MIFCGIFTVKYYYIIITGFFQVFNNFFNNKFRHFLQICSLAKKFAKNLLTLQVSCDIIVHIVETPMKEVVK